MIVKDWCQQPRKWKSRGAGPYAILLIARFFGPGVNALSWSKRRRATGSREEPAPTSAWVVFCLESPFQIENFLHPPGVPAAFKRRR
jgi:hypothetical protein